MLSHCLNRVGLDETTCRTQILSWNQSMVVWVQPVGKWKPNLVDAAVILTASFIDMQACPGIRWYKM